MPRRWLRSKANTCHLDLFCYKCQETFLHFNSKTQCLPCFINLEAIYLGGKNIFLWQYTSSRLLKLCHLFLLLLFLLQVPSFSCTSCSFVWDFKGWCPVSVSALVQAPSISNWHQVCHGNTFSIWWQMGLQRRGKETRFKILLWLISRISAMGLSCAYMLICIRNLGFPSLNALFIQTFQRCWWDHLQ